MDATRSLRRKSLYLPVNVAGRCFTSAMATLPWATAKLRQRHRSSHEGAPAIRPFEREAYGLATLENEKEIMAAGIYRPVDDAVRIAFTELGRLDSRRLMASPNSMLTSCFRRSAKSISPRWSIRTTWWLPP